MTVPSVTRLLKQERSIRLDTLVKFARALEMTLDELLDLQHSAPRPYNPPPERAMVVHDTQLPPRKSR